MDTRRQSNPFAALATSISLRVSMLALLAALVLPLDVSAATIQDTKKFGEPRADKALVYVIRDSAFVGRAVGIFVFADEQLVGFLRNNTYTFAYVPPGVHMIWGDTDSALDMYLVAGETYYVTAQPGNPMSILSTSDGKAAIEKVGAYIESDSADIDNGARRVAKRYDKIRKREAASTKSIEVLPTASASKTGGTVRLPSGTKVQIELMENLLSSLNSTGETVWFRVADDVKADGQVLIQRGTPVKAMLRLVRPGSSHGMQGLLDVALVSIDLDPSRRVAIVGQIASTGHERAVGAVSGGLMGLLIKGTESFHAAGTRFDAWIRDDNWLPPAQPRPAAAVQPATKAASVVLTFGANTREELPEVLLPLPCSAELSDVKLLSIGEWPLTEPVQALEASKYETGCSARFGGWSVLRYVHPGGARQDLHLLVHDGGKEVHIDVPITVRVD